MFRSLIFLGIQVLALVAADCPNPGPAFPNPGLTGNLPAVKQLSADLTATLSAALLRADSGTGGNATSFSIELTSATDTLWTAHHTADELAQPHTVTGDSVFRIASITKMFTVLTVLMQKNMCLEDPITKYIPELRKGGKGDTLKWDKITIRDLASQVGGLFRNYPAGDLSVYLRSDPSDPTTDDTGLPPLEDEDVPECGTEGDLGLCSRQQLLSSIMTRTPIFNPGAHPSYSNTAFTLLGLAVAKASGTTWNKFITKNVFQHLGMKHSFTSHPANGTGVIPVSPNAWFENIGIDTPAGGLYSSSSDLSRFARAILNAQNLPKNKRILEPEVINRWLQPSSFVPSTINAQGMPWEIFRLQSEEITPDGRPVDIYTKNGGLLSYYSIIAFIPEYQVAVTILTAGEYASLSALQELLLPAISKGLETLFRNHAKTLAGTYTATNGLNSSMTLEVDSGPGLKITNFISNSTDMLPLIDQTLLGGLGGLDMRASPSGVEKAEGESWRIKVTSTKIPTQGLMGPGQLCFGDANGPDYGGKPLLEIVKRKESLWLPGFRVELFPGGEDGVSG